MIPARLEELRAVIEQKAALHPELRRPLGLAGFRRVLARDKVTLVMQPHPRIAQLLPSLRGWSIIVDKNQPAPARLLCACHELAHLWLHHDPFFPRYETSVYDQSPPWYDARREEEADAFAEMLVRGPEKAVSPALPKSQRRANNRVTPQLLLDPEGDAFAEQMWRHAQIEAKERAPRKPVGRLVQFAIRRDLWQSVSFDAIRQRGEATPQYDRIAQPDHELVTCSEDAAIAIIEQLARDGRRGAKRAAALIRRTVRQTIRARANRSSVEARQLPATSSPHSLRETQ